MLKILIIVLALAAYGANALFNRYLPSTPVAEVAATNENAEPIGIVASLTGAAASAVTGAVGLHLTAMPEQGCQPGVVSSERIQDLLAQLPAGQQQVLARLLSSKTLSSAPQLYSGDQGFGLCLPGLEKVVLLPPGAAALIGKLRPS